MKKLALLFCFFLMVEFGLSHKIWFIFNYHSTHANPMVPVAVELLERNHSVTLFGPSEVVTLIS